MSGTPELLAAAVGRLGGGERAGQLEMAEEVARTLREPRALLVQAGTGTGKSLGYLVPVLDHAVRHHQRAVVSTATLALQRQVLTHDVPLVADVVAASGAPRPQVALLKGWHNYMCKHKVAGGYPTEDEPGLFAVDAATADAGGASRGPLAEQVVRLREWAEETDTGDRDDLDPGVGDRAWRQVSVTKLECLGASCPMLEECFPEAARRAAHEADVVVTNHAMLGIAAAGSPRVLPEHEVLVVDEAHELAERVTAQSTLELSTAVVDRTARLARKHTGVAVEALDAAGRALGAWLETAPTGRLRSVPAELLDALALLEAGSREAISAMRGESDAEAGGRLMARSAMVVLHEIAERLLGDGVAQRREVLWCERGRTGFEAARLHLAPLDVARPIATELLAGKAAVLTSATLSLGGTFAPVARTLGVSLLDHLEPDDDAPRPAPGPRWHGIDVGSPFDYGRQGILYVARHLPAPGREGPGEDAQRELVELVRASGGGALGLFSSRRAAEEAAELLRGELDTPVLCQGEDQLPSLVRRFAEDESATLVGTLSLWQGVDVPGRTCRLVVIDRIPFPRPDDPIRSARSEVVAASGGNGFMSVAATHAALLLAQGAGRLIRSTEDRGVVAVLDSRLATARYGGFLRGSMPPLWPTTDGEVARAALRRLAAQPAPTP
ncbi:ATP-dependent DNA helicase DinG [Georgenia satyanarayanai]|uniref:DNA 5'-3' helicase n=1 Tax=Georgenia satyanarayanai TaxID=860221 RepID=A0A2Y9ACX7_9MICO|nr:ATP-dependent DNA helicase [Georgenia satyanarayanai]PYF99852.1 ATP-dependent DNA helicase DinG [Georgenia satyanarayanai]SSA41836.1 ATP-dependent DNA helicase DinG [Georgenia satyanarayanai]